MFSKMPKRTKNYIPIKDVAKSIKLLETLGQLAVTKLDYFLVGVIGFIVNYFYFVFRQMLAFKLLPNI